MINKKIIINSVLIFLTIYLCNSILLGKNNIVYNSNCQDSINYWMILDSSMVTTNEGIAFSRHCFIYYINGKYQKVELESAKDVVFCYECQKYENNGDSLKLFKYADGWKNTYKIIRIFLFFSC